MSVGSIPIYPANLATIDKNLMFWCPKRPFWTPKRDMMRYEMPITFFSTLRIFYVKMATSEMGGSASPQLGTNLLVFMM